MANASALCSSVANLLLSCPTAPDAPGSEWCVLFPWLNYFFSFFSCLCFCLFRVLPWQMLKSSVFSSFREIPCHSVANASADSWFYFRGKWFCFCLCFLPWLLLPSVKFRVIPWQCLCLVFCLFFLPWQMLINLLLIPYKALVFQKYYNSIKLH